MWWTMVGGMRLTAYISGWPTYVISKGRKTTWLRWPFEIITICFPPVGFFFPKLKFSKFHGYKHSFVLTSVLGWLAASCIKLCHESRRQVLLPKRIFRTRRLLQLQSAPYKHFQPILGRKETCFPTTMNHCSLSNFSGIALWTSFTPFISSLCITQQSRIHNFLQLDALWKAE